jgi:hypothetical protein
VSEDDDWQDHICVQMEGIADRIATKGSVDGNPWLRRSHDNLAEKLRSYQNETDPVRRLELRAEECEVLAESAEDPSMKGSYKSLAYSYAIMAEDERAKRRFRR